MRPGHSRSHSSSLIRAVCRARAGGGTRRTVGCGCPGSVTADERHDPRARPGRRARRGRPLHVVAVRAVDALAAHAGRRGVAGLPLPHHRGVVHRRRPRRGRHARRRDGGPRRRGRRHRRRRDRAARASPRASPCSPRRSTPACSASHPPFFKRQVNEYWLGRYRAWVYGSGFGWQIGAGVTTYIMTAAVFLTVALGALTAGPVAALRARRRASASCAASRCCSPPGSHTAELFALHRRFDALGEPVRRAVIGVQLAVAVVAARARRGAWWPPPSRSGADVRGPGGVDGASPVSPAVTA